LSAICRKLLDAKSLKLDVQGVVKARCAQNRQDRETGPCRGFGFRQLSIEEKLAGHRDRAAQGPRFRVQTTLRIDGSSARRTHTPDRRRQLIVFRPGHGKTAVARQGQQKQVYIATPHPKRP